MAHNSFQLSLRHSLQTEILNTTVALSITPKRMVRLKASIECSKTVCRPLGLKVKSGKLLWQSFCIHTEQLQMLWQNYHLLSFCMDDKWRQTCMWVVFHVWPHQRINRIWNNSFNTLKTKWKSTRTGDAMHNLQRFKLGHLCVLGSLESPRKDIPSLLSLIRLWPRKA